MRTLIALLVLVVLTAGPVSAADDAVKGVVAAQLPASGAPGVAYAVVADGEITSAGGEGILRRGGEDRVTSGTLFLTGSISKSFTALAVMQLVEAGQVQLDADVSAYLEGFSGQPGGDLTIRQLLSHTSGFSTVQGNVRHTDDTGGADDLARRVDQLAQIAPESAPGREWEYSNTNYQILGRVIEVVSGQEYQSFVTEHILEPIGMRDSFVADGGVHPAMATGHRPWFGAKRPLPENRTHRATAPQGGVVASADDLARYLQTMMNGHDDVLSADGKRLMMQPASDAAPFYGLGWFVDASSGTVWHSGSTPGYETLATMMPSEKRAVVVLVNAGSGIGFGETAQLRNTVTAEALGLDYHGEGSRLPQKALFTALVLLPIGYLLSMVWAWHHRVANRAKSGIFGLFSLWFPLATTLAAAWVMLSLVPRLFGTTLASIHLFQPDLGLVLTAGAVTGVLWAVLRLWMAYTGRAAAQLSEIPPGV